MIRLVLGQYRSLIVTTVVLVVLVDTVLLWHGSKTGAITAQAVAAGCPTGPSCADLRSDVLDSYKQFGHPLDFLIVLPAVVGAFWGAPLVARELEQHTACLAWTQSISRRRWLLARWLVLGAIITVCGGAVGIGITWWSQRYRNLLTLTGGQPQALLAQNRGFEPPIWWLAAFLLGAAVGILLKRTLGAMALTAGLLIVLAIGLSTTPAAIRAAQTGWGTDLARAQLFDAGLLLGLAAAAAIASIWLINKADV